MIAWMLYTVLVGVCVVVAASAAEWLARLSRRPARFVWVAAAVLCVALSMTARLRTRAAPRAEGQPIDLASLGVMQTGLRSVERHVPASAVWYVAALWALASAAVAVSFVLVYSRLRRARDTWPVVDLQGHRVRVSPNVGPIVVGFVQPEIVVPRWVLSRSPEEQRVMLAHESEHVRRGDPIVLGVACALVALMPWNPALWIILSRIRLAVEIDCDGRVLRGGVQVHSYGSLLVDVAERTPRLRFASIALSDDSSHLYRRILAMQPRRITHPLIRGASVALVGLAGLLAACEAKMPTAEEIDHMDVASAQRSARALGILSSDSSVSWSIDGVASTEAAAKAIPADSIASVSVNKLDPLGGKHIYLVTKRGEQLSLATNGQAGAATRRAMPGVEGKPDAVGGLAAAATREQPLLLIDGTRSDPSVLKTIDRERIASVEVLKGAAAIQEYGEDAKRGVIIVKTKPAGTP